ncbi:serine/threonine-protein kinase SRPK-like [Macadamia integrifolia]|uniref:serine/threonine-protein kinase SRPK-like n=1 Tax=Macadamia integrifolia TaxID=60698 RepID=UPI001C4FE2F1|nr:serine/threonine-protein kinase SRPK-like [Macadamia integrifolia]
MGDNQKEDRSESSEFTSEDEGTEDYRRGGYHAVRIGDTFKGGRYVVQSKLGWGHFSTVWLAWDTHNSWHVALKVQKSAQHYTEAAMDEITILKQIAEGDPDDNKCVVKLLDHFKHSGPNGQHVCMVFEYLGDNLLTLIKYTDYRGVPLHVVKEICFHILVGLDYLHRQLSIIHTDLKPENILLLSTIDPAKDPRKSGAPLILPSTKDKSVFESGAAKDIKNSNGDLTKSQKKKIRRKAKRAAQGCMGQEAAEESELESKIAGAEATTPDAKVNAHLLEDHPATSVFKDKSLSAADALKDFSKESQVCKRGSRSTRQKLLASVDLKCKLVDFGNACWTYKQFTSDIQTRQYRCPEVLLGSKYSTPADLWSFACICFELATGDVLFDPHSGDNFDRDEVWINFCVFETLVILPCHFLTYAVRGLFILEKFLKMLPGKLLKEIFILFSWFMGYDKSLCV